MDKLELLDRIAQLLNANGIAATYDGDNDSGEVIVDTMQGIVIIKAEYGDEEEDS